MKKLFFLTFVFFFSCLYAQYKIGYIDSETILAKLPEAQEAQKRIEMLIADYQKQLAEMEREWKSKYDDYEKRKLIMSPQLRQETERQLIEMEKKINDFRQEKFGANGELFQKQQEIMKPIHNKIFNAIKEYAEAEKYDFIFDRSGDLIFLYVKPEHDLTNIILEKLFK